MVSNCLRGLRGRKQLCLMCLVATCIASGYWLVDFNRSSGNSPRLAKVEQTQTPESLHNYSWHFRNLQKVIDDHMFHIDWKRLMPLMRQDANETSREFRVRAGLAWMRSQRLVVAATVRNAMRGLPDSLRNVNRLRALFNSSWLVIVENDSTDQTREYLHDLTTRDPTVWLLGCGKVNSREPCKPDARYRSGKLHQPGWEMQRTREDVLDRGMVMAALRNQYLEYTYDHLVPIGATLLMGIDADITWHSWDLDSIAQGLYYFMAKPKLQQLCSHASVYNRAQVYDPCSLTFFHNRHFGDEGTKPLTYDNALRNSAPDLPPLKVASCFQAVAFYRLAGLVAGRVMYGGAPNEWNCEHNTLSRKLSEVYIDPQMRLDVAEIFPHG